MAASDGRSGKSGGASSDRDLDRRLERLSRDLEAERREREAFPPSRRGGDGGGYAQALKLSSEFVAGVLVGAALGWGLDHVAGTSPWGLIGFLLLGFCAGVLNVVRSAGRIRTDGVEQDKE